MRPDSFFDPICQAAPDKTFRIVGASVRSCHLTSRTAAGVCVSLLAHPIACVAAMLVQLPVDPPPPESQPMAVRVEFVPDPTIKKEERQEVQKGAPQSQADHDAEPEENHQKPVEMAKINLLIPLDTRNLKKVPIRRPKLEPRKSQMNAHDKTKVAMAKGLADALLPDVDMGDALQTPGRMEATIGEEITRGIVKDMKAQERWQMLLIAHLEHRKRYPLSALSHRQEGKVFVRFHVKPDGMVVDAELVQSSNVPALDEEVLDLMHRASPVPKPPPGVVPFITLPLNFTMRH
ncbi:MAG: energy transducer TonB [Rhizobium sp.]|nr:MAG: energy transducer TonB [Rhizobium sp.]